MRATNFRLETLETRILLNADVLPVADLQLQPLLEEALVRFADLGVDERRLESARNVSVEVEDLPGWTIAETVDDTIRIDSTAAGLGWFVDETPEDNTEFQPDGADLVATSEGPAAGRVDLLTVLAHELGHYLGLSHTSEGLMNSGIRPGVRRLPDVQIEQLIETLHGANAPPETQQLIITPTIFWNVDSDGSWDVAANWLDTLGVSRVPTAADDVLIDRGSANPIITISVGSQTARSLLSKESLILSGGSLTL
ncbi:MAG TPA: matrixin family metalloprotease, partial [Terriglobia bacterium]|nr:matrixin family metalloprotease [Terriglobia bacterium]